ncbi:glycosyltransferase [Pedobacter sp. SL55]|uniref:glycosyltransferase n=1 Tax=Pedobacter sp. SL55 TaxID=2995161 RepID=UPI0022710B0F|nr:glycosyltransferase [Pedobacter sp. SL55]WAC41742.1 glycosyltransferase [Pedobacter sp. SL55]
MSKNKITRWIDRSNFKVCLILNRKYYYKTKTKGSLFAFYKDIFIYPLFAARFLLVLLQIFRFNSKLLISYPDQKLTSLSKKVSHYISVFAGLRYFIKEEYTPLYYEEKLPLSELSFCVNNSPKVSIIIPVYNQLNFTLNCLRSLKLNLSKEIPVEIIVINDASRDQTPQEIEKIAGLKLINNVQNLGFLLSCRKAIDESKGEYICLLNNDTVVLKGWLEGLLNTIEKDPLIGLVGSKLIHSFGLLQEAGSIIHDKGDCGNYGAFRDPNYYAYNFSREVDYCSGASLIFSRSDYEQLNGLDVQYTPAYYEDTDFCLSIKHLLHKKVVYQPLSALVHFEGVSSGKKAKKGNIKSYQAINKEKFANKWHEQLKYHLPYKDIEASIRRHIIGKTIVIIDSYLPRFDKESGSHRVYELVKIFKDLNFHLVFIPNDGIPEQPYFNLLTSNGIEVVTKYLGSKKFKKDVISACKNADYIWACRPELNKKYSFIRKHVPSAKWIYDTVDLHYIRLTREAALVSSEEIQAKADEFKTLELSLAEGADITVCITDVEQRLLQNEGISNTIVVPNIHTLPVRNNRADFDSRRDLLFVGSYDHTPNVDSVVWLCKEIMPIIWEKDANIKVHLVGNNPKPEVLCLANDHIKVHGYVEHLEPFFNSCRVFVAPLRYGAGMKGKIGQALSYGLPTVTTDIGSEGMGLNHQKNIFIANNIENFASSVLRLYQTEDLWNSISKNSIDAIQKYSPETISEYLKKNLFRYD